MEIERLALGKPKKEKETVAKAWAHDDETDEYYFSSALLEIEGVTWPYFSIPRRLYDSLYPHQKVGVQWMASMHSNKTGGILADDMGLGKTWSTLTYIGGLMRAKVILSSLVVAPTSLLRTWEKESKKVIVGHDCLPKLKIHVLSSSMKRHDRQRIIQNALDGRNSRIPHLIITSYGLVSNDPSDFLSDNHGFDYVVLDEAHKIKNNTTQLFKSCSYVCKHEDTRRLLLTGTPIQNNLVEMWTLFDFATSGCLLGPLKRFTKDFGDPIELGRSKNATASTRQTEKKANADLQLLLKPHFLQRMKDDVLPDMPPKKDFVVWTHISSQQRRLYEDFVSNSDTVNAVLTGEKKSPLEAVTWLKKLAGHPLLVDTKYDRELSTLRQMRKDDLIKSSAKVEILAELVDKLSKSGHRILVFSGSTMMLDIIERALDGDGLKMSRIDGSTKERDRQRNVEEFNNENSSTTVMLLSTKAGGLGLTLTGADRAIIFDPSWNPTDDSQAVDRCYRIGQRRPVEVYRFIAAGTVEEKMYEKQIFKDGIRRVVTTSTGSNTHRYFDKYELSKLFHLSKAGECPVLQKLQEQNRIGEVNFSTQKYFFEGHKDVVGLSSHDAVYMEPMNSSKQETISAPFSGETKVGPHRIIGKSQRVLRDNNSNVIGKKVFKHPEKSPMRPLNKPSIQFMSYDRTKYKVESLRGVGKNEEALHQLMNLLENKEQLTNEQLLWTHKQCAAVSTNLKWLKQS